MEHVMETNNISSSLQQQHASRRLTTSDGKLVNGHGQEWAAIEKLPLVKQLRTSLSYRGYLYDTDDKQAVSVVDVKDLGDAERHLFIDNLLKRVEDDNHRLLRKVRERMNRVGLDFPTVEVRYKNLRVEAEYLPHEESLPTIWNALKSISSERRKKQNGAARPRVYGKS